MDKKQIDYKIPTADWKMIGVRMPPELIKAIKHYALDHDTSMQDITIEALRDYLKKQGVKVSKKI